MSIDWPNLLLGGAVGFLVGLLANAAYARLHARAATAELRKKHQGIAGHYRAFRFRGPPDNPACDMIDYDEAIGNCKITYERENILKLQYTEIKHDNIWEALIWMETPFVGSMAWHYIRLGGRQPPTEHRFGFKECVVSNRVDRDGSSRQYLYLIGNPPFGNEALEKS